MDNLDNGQKNSSLYIASGAILIVLAAAGILLFSNRNNLNSSSALGADQSVISDTSDIQDMEKENTTDENNTNNQVEIVNIEGGNFFFDPNEIRVKKGDTVKIVFKNTGGTHNWLIDEFNAKTKIIQSGETVEVEFVADMQGEFEFYCSVGNHRELGMVGTLIVE
jgi:plastocyanin